MRFQPGRGFERQFDVRDRRPLLGRIRHPPAEGVLWPLIGSRRSGKTWTLRALELLLNEQEPESSSYVSLEEQHNLTELPDSKYLLLDEPGFSDPQGERLPSDLLEWCASAKLKRRRIIVAMTPAEWSLLSRAGLSPRRVSDKNLLYIEPLTRTEALKLAHEPWAHQVVDDHPSWASNPYLLELLLSRLEQRPAEQRAATPELFLELLMWCDEDDSRYFPHLFTHGLDAEQREILRKVARGETPASGQRTDVLVGCGLLRREDNQLRVADPVIEAMLTPLRIHHVSDVHFGDKTAIQGDRKEEGAHADAMARVVGHGPLSQKYLEYLKELAQKRGAPQVLVVSGDIAERGTEDEFSQARRWLDLLKPYLGKHPLMDPKDETILLVGGNHDVDWTQALGKVDSHKRHEKFAEHFKGLKHPGLQLPPAERKELAVARYRRLGVEILLLGSAELGGEPREEPSQGKLVELVEALRKAAIDAPLPGEADELRNQIARIDPGLVNHEDLSRVRGQRWKEPVRVAVLHHPVSPLPVTEIARFSGLLNAGAVKQTLMNQRFCLVLHGHMHIGWFGLEQWPEEAPGWALRIAAAPSLGSQEVQSKHGFNEIEVIRLREEGDREYMVTVRRFEREGQEWRPKATMRFRPGKPEELPEPPA